MCKLALQCEAIEGDEICKTYRAVSVSVSVSVRVDARSEGRGRRVSSVLLRERKMEGPARSSCTSRGRYACSRDQGHALVSV